MIKKILQKTFKIISYEIFFKIYGKIKKSINHKEDQRIEVKNVNADKDLKYKVFIITDGRLYTDRINDTAVLLDNKIIEEPSFQLRYGNDSKIYNSVAKNNIVFKKGTPRKLKKINGSVLSLLTGGAGNKNYWHWLFDVLPRLSLCNKAINISEIDYFLIPSLAEKFQIETLNCLDIPVSKRLSSEKFRHLKSKKLIITDHPVVISKNPTDDMMNMPIWISKWLKENFLKKDIVNDNKNVKRIYIDRGDPVSEKSLQRYISNEDEVKKYLLKNNFTSVKLHELNFVDQVKLFYNAECIIGLHGGGFANIVFCKPGTKIIELRSLGPGAPIENLAKKNNLNYSSIAVERKKDHGVTFPDQQGVVHVPINNLSNLIKNVS